MGPPPGTRLAAGTLPPIGGWRQPAVVAVPAAAGIVDLGTARHAADLGTTAPRGEASQRDHLDDERHHDGHHAEQRERGQEAQPQRQHGGHARHPGGSE